MYHFLRAALTVIAVALTLGLLPDGADARVGGASSFGSRGSRSFSAPPETRTAPSAAQPIQRSTTQPNGLSKPRLPPTSDGWLSRPGLLGGLAGGLFGAGLFGALFGQGLFGGLAGAASLFGLVIQIALITTAAMLIWRWLQHRGRPAIAERRPSPGAGPSLGPSTTLVRIDAGRERPMRPR